MTTTYYLGKTSSGAFVGRGSNRTDYRFAGVRKTNRTWSTEKQAYVDEGPWPAGQPVRSSAASFSTTPDGALRNVMGNWKDPSLFEVIPVEIVDAKTFRKSMGRG